MTFESLKESLDKSFIRGPLKPAVLAIKVEEEVEKKAPQWAKMVSFKDGRLTLEVPSPAHAQELYLESRELLKKINEGVGRKVSDKIRFRVTDG